MQKKIFLMVLLCLFQACGNSDNTINRTNTKPTGDTSAGFLNPTTSLLFKDYELAESRFSEVLNIGSFSTDLNFKTGLAFMTAADTIRTWRAKNNPTSYLNIQSDIDSIVSDLENNYLHLFIPTNEDEFSALRFYIAVAATEGPSLLLKYAETDVSFSIYPTNSNRDLNPIYEKLNKYSLENEVPPFACYYLGVIAREKEKSGNTYDVEAQLCNSDQIDMTQFRQYLDGLPWKNSRP